MSLMRPFRVQRALSLDDVAGGAAPPTSGGVTVQEAETLRSDALTAFDPGVGAPVLTATVDCFQVDMLTELGYLATTKFWATPGTGHGRLALLVAIQWTLHNVGAKDLSPTHTPAYRIELSTCAGILSEAEALAENSLTHLYVDVHKFPELDCARLCSRWGSCHGPRHPQRWTALDHYTNYSSWRRPT